MRDNFRRDTANLPLLFAEPVQTAIVSAFSVLYFGLGIFLSFVSYQHTGWHCGVDDALF